MSARLAWAGMLIVLAALLPADAAAQQLKGALEQVAAAWARSDATAVANHAGPAGVALDVDGSPTGPFPPRQAAAVLRRVFEDRETLNVQVGLAKEVGGEPARGFGELNWVVRARGTTIPERVSIFVALVKVEGRWHVSEIRLMP
ncbi:MAG: hypothetical protein WEB88_09015 [Gemmatimonadota bacterium]